jgi:hypothetical protein
VSASVVLGRDLHIQMIFAAVDVPVLDLTIRELHVPIPVRQVVFVGPSFDFARLAIRPSVRVRPAPIPLVQPLLVFPLQLLLQPHALNLHPLCLEFAGVTFVRAADLTVVFEFAFPADARMEDLTAVVVAVSIDFQQIPAAVGQDHRLLAIARDTDRLNEALLSEVPQVAVTRVGGPVVAAPKVAGRDDSKRSNCCQGAAL